MISSQSIFLLLEKRYKLFERGVSVRDDLLHAKGNIKWSSDDELNNNKEENSDEEDYGSYFFLLLVQFRSN